MRTAQPRPPPPRAQKCVCIRPLLQVITLDERLLAFTTCCDEKDKAVRQAATSLFHSRLILISAFGQSEVEALHALPLPHAPSSPAAKAAAALEVVSRCGPACTFAHTRINPCLATFLAPRTLVF